MNDSKALATAAPAGADISPAAGPTAAKRDPAERLKT